MKHLRFTRLVVLFSALLWTLGLQSMSFGQCCGSPSDGKKITVHVSIWAADCVGTTNALLNIKWTEPEPINADHNVVTNQTYTIYANSSYDTDIQVPFGAEVSLDLTNLDNGTSGSHPILASLSSPCPDSQKIQGQTTPTATDAIHLKLKVKHLDQTSAASDCAKKLGSIDLNFGMGRLAGGIAAGDIWMEEPSITPVCFTRRSLRYGRADGEDGVHVVYDGAGDTKALRQVVTPSILADIVDLGGGGFEIRYYTPSDPVNYFRKWSVTDPGGAGPARLRVAAYNHAGDLIEGSETIYTQESTAFENETLGLVETSPARHERRNVAIVEDDPDYPGQSVEVRTVIVTDPAADTVPVTRQVQKLIDDKLRQVREGVGADEQITVYNYDATSGALQSTVRFNAQGHLIDSSIMSGADTLTPFKDAIAARRSLSGGEQINGQSVRVTYTEDFGTSMTTRYGAVDSISVQRTSTMQSTGTGGTLTTMNWTIPSDASDPLVAGRLLRDEGPDGAVREYWYEKGDWSSPVFTPNLAGTAERNTVYEDEVDAGGDSFAMLSHVSRKTVTITDEFGNLAAEESYVFMDGSFVLLVRTLHTYDGEGHLLQSNQDGRTVYSATWVDGLKRSETDETGIVTNYSSFDNQGRAWHSEREGMAASGGMSGIPTLVTDLIYDAAGRKTQETATDGFSTTTHSWLYDSLGRLKTETVNGVVTGYVYTYSASGGQIVTKTLPGGAIEITESYLNGQTKSITGTGVVPQIFDYGVDGSGHPWQKVTTGADANPLWVTTTSDWVGNTLSVDRPGSEGTVTDTMDYDYAGRLLDKTLAGHGERFYSYDLLHGESSDGTPAKISGSTLATSADGTRSEQTAEYYSVDAGEYYFVTETKQGKTMEKVGGFASSELAKTITVNLRGIKTTTVTIVDRPNAKVTATTTCDSVGNSAVTVSRLGLAQSIVSFSGGDAALYSYDGFGRQVSFTDPRTGALTNITYDPVFGSVATVAAGTLLTTNIYYGADEASPGCLKSQTVNGLATYFGYDTVGRKIRIWGPAAYPLRYEFDGNGRLFHLFTYRTGNDAQGNPGGGPDRITASNVTTWSYFPGTTLVQAKTDAASHAVNYTYYPSGLVKRRTWARGLMTDYVYNEAGELNTTAYSDGSTPGVSLGYNDNGQPLNMIDAAGTHTLHYDPMGQEYTGDEVAAGDGILAGASLVIGRDAYGRLNGLQVSQGTTALLGSGQAFTYEPATGRMSTAGDGTNTATYAYLPNSDWLSTTVISRSGMADALTHTRTPDTLGRLAIVAATRGTQTIESHTWHYDGGGRRDRDTLGDLSYWAYSYNDRSEVTSGVKHLPPPGEAVTLGRVFGYDYDSIGNRKESWVNGRKTKYTTNALNQYEKRTVPPSVEVLGSAAPEAVVKVTGPQGSQVASRQGALFSATLPVDNETTAQFPEIDIEARRSTTTGSATTETKSTPSGKLFLAKQPEELGYDPDGNTLNDGRWNYIWDGENRLIAVETGEAAATAGVPRIRVEYAYDGRGRRIARTLKTAWNSSTHEYVSSETHRFLYDAGFNVLAEIDASGVAVRRCLWGMDSSERLGGMGGIGGLLVESIVATSTDYLPFYDGNGNVMGLIQAADGTEAARYSFGPFGELLRQSGTFAETNTFRWSTKYQDPVTGLKDYGYRWLADARWLSRDPLGETAGGNIYAMCNNSPWDNIDPDGRDFIAVGSNPSMHTADRKWSVPAGMSSHLSISYWHDTKLCILPGAFKQGTNAESNYWAMNHAISMFVRQAVAVPNDAAIKKVVQLGFSTYSFKGSGETVDLSEVHISDDCDADFYVVIYADSTDKRDAFQKWQTILRAVKNYPYAEQDDQKGAAQKWPNSKYGKKFNGNFNNSNTFVHYLVDSIGLSVPDMEGRPHQGNTMPKPVYDPRPAPFHN